MFYVQSVLPDTNKIFHIGLPKLSVIQARWDTEISVSKKNVHYMSYYQYWVPNLCDEVPAMALKRISINNIGWAVSSSLS